MLHALVLGIILFAAFLSYFASNVFVFGFQESVPISGLSLPAIGGAPASEEPVLTSIVLPHTVRRAELEQGMLAYAGQATQQDAAAPQVETVLSTPYYLYTVQPGDTAGSIAVAFGIQLSYLLWANPDLRDGELLTVGQMLIVPAGNGILHHVRYGETLSDIAVRYSVGVEAILGWLGNGISSADQVVEDQLVFVPNGVPPVTLLPEPTPVPTEAPIVVEAPPAVPAPPPAQAPPAVAGSSGLIWPVYGPISSYMDASHPLGIDIDLVGNPFAAIGAATSGTVVFAGGNPCCSYGLYVVIMSPSGIETLYAHLSSISVSVGQQVSQGQVIGNGGCTGYCTGNHLHFEVIDNGVRVNPLSYLP